MTDHHPITPPPELIGRWIQEWINIHGPDKEGIDYVVVQAAQYAADQELEACCAWLHEELKMTVLTLDVGLRAARRPSPSPGGLTQ